MEDDQIISLYWRRDEAAIAETARKYGGLCYYIANNILANREDSEECVNDTWYGTWNAIPATKPDRLGVFVSRIARNLALDRYDYLSAARRDPKAVCSLDELGECVSGRDTVESELDSRRIRRAIEDFLWRQDTEKRVIFIRRYWYFESIASLAKRSGYSQSKIKSMLFHLRQKLRAYFRKRGYRTMNKRQLSEHIGGIDDRLVQEARRMPNYAKQHRQKLLRQFAAVAAVFVLMVSSAAVGAAAFSQETVVEVPVQQEIVELKGIGLSLILPDEWAGRYTVINETFAPYGSPMWEFCVSKVYDSGSTDELGIPFRGMLFTVFQCADRPLSLQEFEAESGIAGIGRYLLATENATYAILYASDIQFDYTDEAQMAEYNDLMYGSGGMEDSIQVVVHGAVTGAP